MSLTTSPSERPSVPALTRISRIRSRRRILDGAHAGLDVRHLAGRDERPPSLPGQVESQQVDRAGCGRKDRRAGGRRSCRRRGPRTGRPPRRPPARVRWRPRCRDPGPDRPRPCGPPPTRTSGWGCSSLVSTSTAPGVAVHKRLSTAVRAGASRARSVPAQADLDRLHVATQSGPPLRSAVRMPRKRASVPRTSDLMS